MIQDKAQRKYKESLKGKLSSKKILQRRKKKYKTDPVYRSKMQKRSRQYGRVHRRDIRIRAHHISLVEYETKLLEQNRSCAICGTVFTETPAIDHAHACCSGKKSKCGKCVRGLLCAPCNSALGYFKDSKHNLQKAILYLEKWAEGKSIWPESGYKRQLRR